MSDQVAPIYYIYIYTHTQTQDSKVSIWKGFWTNFLTSRGWWDIVKYDRLLMYMSYYLGKITINERCWCVKEKRSRHPSKMDSNRANRSRHSSKMMPWTRPEFNLYRQWAQVYFILQNTMFFACRRFKTLITHAFGTFQGLFRGPLHGKTRCTLHVNALKP